MQEASVYIENLKQEYLLIAHGEPNTPFDPVVHLPMLAICSANYDTHRPVTPSNCRGIISSTPLGTPNRSPNVLFDSDENSTVHMNPTAHTVGPNDQFIMPKEIQIPAGNKRKATVATSNAAKVPKFVPLSEDMGIVSDFMKVNFQNYITKSNRLCEKIDHFNEKMKVNESEKLAAELKRLNQEKAKLSAQYQRLHDEMNEIKNQWEIKMQAVKCQQWCISCGNKTETPFYCSKTCQTDQLPL